jgi:hypothetical protein
MVCYGQPFNYSLFTSIRVTDHGQQASIPMPINCAAVRAEFEEETTKKEPLEDCPSGVTSVNQCAETASANLRGCAAGEETKVENCVAEVEWRRKECTSLAEEAERCAARNAAKKAGGAQ